MHPGETGRERGLEMALQPPHYAEFAALLPNIKHEALTTGRSHRLMRTGLSISYSISPCENGHYHHVSVAFGPYTPRAIGSNYLLFFTAAFGVPWKVVGFGVTESSIHHAHFRTFSLRDFAADPIVPPAPLHQFFAEAHAAPIQWTRITAPGAG